LYDHASATLKMNRAIQFTQIQMMFVWRAISLMPHHQIVSVDV
jgi:hypothetical protein